jgi:15-cis-phytoene synthase
MRVAEAEATIAAGSQSFAAAARLLPRAIRDDAVQLYAWCRHADDVIDGQALGQALGSAPPSPDHAAARLAQLRAETQAALRGDECALPPFAALRIVARRHGGFDRWPLELVDGLAMDVEGRRYVRIEDTLDYAYHVAGVVGVMMARIMGVRDEAVLDRACDLGIAFQLTNIARDVRDDYRIGRIYLPEDWLAAAGAEVADEIPSPALHKVILRLLDTADLYYGSARAGLPALPLRAAWSIAAALRIYRAVGERIRAAGPTVYRDRVATGGATKARLALLALSDAGRSRLRADCVDRTGLWTRTEGKRLGRARSDGG